LADKSVDREELQRVFQLELDRLGAAASRTSLVESVMRLRALTEIAETMETPDLLNLAVGMQSAQRSQ
jgi:hypothetical protein